MDDYSLTEVKNVKYQSYTNQLRDFLSYWQRTGKTFNLIVRQNTTLSSKLQDLVDEGKINLLPILKAK
jgi:hypothetical protein